MSAGEGAGASAPAPSLTYTYSLLDARRIVQQKVDTAQQSADRIRPRLIKPSASPEYQAWLNRAQALREVLSLLEHVGTEAPDMRAHRLAEEVADAYAEAGGSLYDTVRAILIQEFSEVGP